MVLILPLSVSSLLFFIRVTSSIFQWDPRYVFWLVLLGLSFYLTLMITGLNFAFDVFFTLDLYLVLLVFLLFFSAFFFSVLVKVTFCSLILPAYCMLLCLGPHLFTKRNIKTPIIYLLFISVFTFLTLTVPMKAAYLWWPLLTALCYSIYCSWALFYFTQQNTDTEASRFIEQCVWCVSWGDMVQSLSLTKRTSVSWREEMIPQWNGRHCFIWKLDFFIFNFLDWCLSELKCTYIVLHRNSPKISKSILLDNVYSCHLYE